MGEEEGHDCCRFIESRVGGKENNDERPENRRDLLWEGLGSLTERLAGVDNLFDQLEEEMDNDREV